MNLVLIEGENEDVNESQNKEYVTEHEEQNKDDFVRQCLENNLIMHLRLKKTRFL